MKDMDMGIDIVSITCSFLNWSRKENGSKRAGLNGPGQMGPAKWAEPSAWPNDPGQMGPAK